MTRTASIGVRIEPTTKNLVEILARSDGRSVAHWIERLLERQMAEASYIDVRSDIHKGVWYVFWRPASGGPLELLLPSRAMEFADCFERLENLKMAVALRNAAQAASNQTTFDAEGSQLGPLLRGDEK